MILQQPNGSQGNCDINWHTFINNIKSGTWNPLLNTTSPPTNITLANAFFSISGSPLCYFNIVLQGNGTGISWTTGEYITLPFQNGTLKSSETTTMTAPIPVYQVGTGTVLGWVNTSLGIKTATLVNNGANITGAANGVLALQGFYFTGIQ